MNKIRTGLALMILVSAVVMHYGCIPKKEFKVKRIAHAGGGVEKKTYTNSYDALDYNIKKGFTYFELDFSFTQDERLVCLHDWTHSFKRSFGFSTEKKVTLTEFKKLVQEKSKFNKCTLDGLSLWLQENPSAYIVTDVKEDNYKALQIIAAAIKNSANRVIPQIYDPNNFKKTKELGYKQIIWTLYRYQGDDTSVLDWVKTFEHPFAVTMPKQRTVTSLPLKLQEEGIATYVHTVNSNQEKKNFFNKHHITEIYTDFLVQ